MSGLIGMHMLFIAFQGSWISCKMSEINTACLYFHWESLFLSLIMEEKRRTMSTGTVFDTGSCLVFDRKKLKGKPSHLLRIPRVNFRVFFKYTSKF